MTLLVAGLVVFIASHSIGIVAPAWRAQRVERLGEGRWKLVYSLVSLVALVLIVYGYGAARGDPTPLWAPPPWSRHATALLAVLGFVLVAAAYVRHTRIKAAIVHPMTAGVALWALGHLLGNGTLRSVVLFGGLLAWAVIVFVVRVHRDRAAGVARPPGLLRQDAIAVVAGIAVSVAFALWLHAPLIGVRPFAV